MLIPVIKYGASVENQKVPHALSQASHNLKENLALPLCQAGMGEELLSYGFLVASRFTWFQTGTALKSWKLLQDMKNVSCPALAWRFLYHQIKWSIMAKIASLVQFIIV